MDIDNLTETKVSDDLNVNHPLGRDEFLYDLIGINVMGLKSLGTLITDPADYFKAALTPDWEGRHWPSMRMWIGLMTILIGLQFIWASESSEMTAMFRYMVEAIIQGVNTGAEPHEIIDFTEFDIATAGKTIFKNWIFIYPFFFILFMCLLGFIFRGWDRDLPFIARVRFIFAIIVPGSVIGLLATLAMIPLKGSAYQYASFALMGLLFCAYWITAYRGAYAQSDKSSRIGLSFVISILICVFLFSAQFLSMLIAMFTIMPDIKEFVDAQKALKP